MTGGQEEIQNGWEVRGGEAENFTRDAIRPWLVSDGFGFCCFNYAVSLDGIGGAGGVSELMRGCLIGISAMIGGFFAYWAIYFQDWRKTSWMCALISALAFVGEFALLFAF